MNLKKTTFLALFSVTLFSGCSHTKTSFREPGSAGETAVAWGRTPLSVCWGNAKHLEQTSISKEIFVNLRKNIVNASSEIRKQIQAIITSEYNHSDLGVSFVGWQACDNSVRSDVVLTMALDPSRSVQELLSRPYTVADLMDGLSSVGESGIFDEREGFLNKDSNKPAFVYLKEWKFRKAILPPMDHLKLFALHEFGHIAGLRHEHIRSEAKRDPHCSKDTLTYRDQRSSSTSYFSAYDPNSIMNYCYINNLIEEKAGLHFTTSSKALPNPPGSIPNLVRSSVNLKDPRVFESKKISDDKIEYWIKLRLSEGDRHALRCLYRYTEAEFRKLCR